MATAATPSICIRKYLFFFDTFDNAFNTLETPYGDSDSTAFIRGTYSFKKNNGVIQYKRVILVPLSASMSKEVLKY